MRRLAMALDIDERCDTATPDALLQKAGDVVQELSRLKCKVIANAWNVKILFEIIFDSNNYGIQYLPKFRSLNKDFIFGVRLKND